MTTHAITRPQVREYFESAIKVARRAEQKGAPLTLAALDKATPGISAVVARERDPKVHNFSVSSFLDSPVTSGEVKLAVEQFDKHFAAVAHGDTMSKGEFWHTDWQTHMAVAHAAYETGTLPSTDSDRDPAR